MTGLDKVYGCGALNWDIFFEMPSLDALKNIPSVDFEVKPGGEVVVSREKFMKILSHLENRGKKFFLVEGAQRQTPSLPYPILDLKLALSAFAGMMTLASLF
jgi:ribokinase